MTLLATLRHCFTSRSVPSRPRKRCFSLHVGECPDLGRSGRTGCNGRREGGPACGSPWESRTLLPRGVLASVTSNALEQWKSMSRRAGLHRRSALPRARGRPSRCRTRESAGCGGYGFRRSPRALSRGRSSAGRRLMSVGHVLSSPSVVAREARRASQPRLAVVEGQWLITSPGTSTSRATS